MHTLSYKHAEVLETTETNFLISQYVVSKKFQTERKALVLVVLLTSQQVIHVSFTKA